jgi:hypothetical protein
MPSDSTSDGSTSGSAARRSSKGASSPRPRIAKQRAAEGSPAWRSIRWIWIAPSPVDNEERLQRGGAHGAVRIV